MDIRAKIWDDKGVAAATMQIDGGAAVTPQRIGDTQMWSASFDSTKVSDGDHKITVNVTGAGGNTSEDTITVVVNQAGSYQVPQRAFGASGNSIGAYAEKGLLGSHTTTSGGLSPQGGPPSAPPNGPKGSPSAPPKGP